MKNQFLYFLTIFLMIISSDCSNSNQVAEKDTFLFVHGAYHGKWCWDNIKPLLEAKGHDAIAIDLPAHGEDTTNAENVTLEMYIDKIVEAMENISKPVVLVGHSAGGMAISGVAEKVPEQVKALVYVTAVIPRDGETLLSVQDPNPSGIQFYQMAEDGSVAIVIPEMGKEVFYHDLKEDASLAVGKLTPEPIAPLTTPIKLTEERFGSVPRYYIECTNDKVLSIDLQRLWQERSPCKAVYTMETGHSPFLANPEKLADILLNIDR